jgi:uncharacterized protein YndB with AHSA1/START domain
MNPSDFSPGPLADVSRQDIDGRPTLVFVRTLRHPPERVWAALTVPDEIRQWAPFVSDRNLTDLGTVTLRMTDSDRGQEFPGMVRHAVPPSLLEFTWGDDPLRWELDPEGRGTRLTLHHGVEGPDWLSKVAAGWHLCLVVAERFMDGKPIGPIVGEAAKAYGWEKLNDAYGEALGVHTPT